MCSSISKINQFTYSSIIQDEKKISVSLVENSSKLLIRIYDFATCKLLEKLNLDFDFNSFENYHFVYQDNGIKISEMQKVSWWPYEIPIEDNIEDVKSIGLYKLKDSKEYIWRLTDYKTRAISILTIRKDDEQIIRLKNIAKIDHPDIAILHCYAEIKTSSNEDLISVVIKDELDIQKPEHLPVIWASEDAMILLIKKETNNLLFRVKDLKTDATKNYTISLDKAMTQSQVERKLANSDIVFNQLSGELEILPLKKCLYSAIFQDDMSSQRLCWRREPDARWVRVWSSEEKSCRDTLEGPSNNYVIRSSVEAHLNKNLKNFLHEAISNNNSDSLNNFIPEKNINDPKSKILKSFTLKKKKIKSLINDVFIDCDKWGITLISQGTSGLSKVAFGMEQGHASLLWEGLYNGERVAFLADITNDTDEGELDFDEAIPRLRAFDETKKVRAKTQTWIVDKDKVLNIKKYIKDKLEKNKTVPFDVLGVGITRKNVSWLSNELSFNSKKIGKNHKKELLFSLNGSLIPFIYNFFHPQPDYECNIAKVFIHSICSSLDSLKNRNYIGAGIDVALMSMAFINLYNFDQPQNISLLIEKIRNPDNQYEKFYNCVLWVIELAKIAGIDLPPPKSWHRTPDRYIRWLNQLHQQKQAQAEGLSIVKRVSQFSNRVFNIPSFLKINLTPLNYYFPSLDSVQHKLSSTHVRLIQLNKALLPQNMF